MERKERNEYKKALGRKQRGKGIYILYKGDKPYYVGLSKRSLRRQIKAHTRDKHAPNWDKFSFYQILKTKYIRDVESLLLSYYKPEGNTLKGRFKRKSQIR